MNKRKVVIDTDPGIDDALAIMLALNSPEIDVLALTIVEGNVDAEKGARNASRLLKFLGREDIPIYIGSREPLVIPFRNAEDTHGDDGLGNIDLPEGDGAQNEDAVSYLKHLLNNMPYQEVSLIALGPLTNLARLVLEDPKAAERVKDITWMGGAFRTNGNCSPVAEFNAWCDPHAAQTVLSSYNCPIVMTGLDVTREVVLTPNYRSLMKRAGGSLGELINAMTAFYENFHWEAERTLGVVINDPLAVAAYLDPKLVQGEDYYVKVITEGEAEGMTMVDTQGILKKEKNVHVLTKVDVKGFFNRLFQTLFPDQAETFSNILEEERYGRFE